MSAAEPTRRVDPRIRARRVAVARAAGRRRLRVLLVVGALLCVIGLAWLTVQSPLLDVDHVQVVGAHQVPAAAVLSAADVHRGAALVFVDTDAVARRVERVPGVAAARVSRDLPGTLRIRVTERVPVAWAHRGSAAVLIDRGGRVVRIARSAPSGLPELQGLERVGAAGTFVVPRGAAAVLPQLPPLLRLRVTTIVAKGGDVVLRLAAVGSVPAVEVRLGPPADVAAKGAAATAVLVSLGSHPVGYVDVRVPDAPTSGQ